MTVRILCNNMTEFDDQLLFIFNLIEQCEEVCCTEIVLPLTGNKNDGIGFVKRGERILNDMFIAYTPWNNMREKARIEENAVGVSFIFEIGGDR